MRETTSNEKHQREVTLLLTDKPHYLSVDIDYWVDLDPLRMLFEVGRLLEERPESVPVTAVMNHQQLLWNVNRSEARRLINIDYHSDIREQTIGELHCGSWVSYVTWRTEGEDIWVRPSDDSSLGACNSSLYWNDLTDWQKTRGLFRDPKRFSLHTLLKGCTGIGLCMSPAFVKPKARELFLALVKEYKLPYRSGDVTEFSGVTRKPSGIRAS